MRVCATQIEPATGDIDRNVEKHVSLIDVAVSHRANLIFFPELSLTGYEPGLAKQLAVDPDDHRFDVFQRVADAGGIIIGVGAPTRSRAGILITMIVFQPGDERLTYSKQQLHSDELPFFVHGEKQLILRAGEHAFAPAICYESLQSNHADAVAKTGADIYLASVAKPDRNVVKAYQHYPSIAKAHSMTVLMANSVGRCDNFLSVGQSAIWNSRGECISKMDDKRDGIVMIDTATQEVTLVQQEIAA